jgi:hypothetical protein
MKGSQLAEQGYCPGHSTSFIGAGVPSFTGRGCEAFSGSASGNSSKFT